MGATPSQSLALVPFAYEVFPLGFVSPRGWIEHEIKLSARALGGHLFHFYRFVKQSTWLGGTFEYSALNEATPYWYNYIVPLAFSINEQTDPELAQSIKAQAVTFLEYTLEHQAKDGWLGPEQTRETRGIWARCLLLQGMINHAQADPSRTERLINSMMRFVRLVNSMLKNNLEGFLPGKDDLFDPQRFGLARAHELSLNLQWLFEKIEDPADKATIWEIMDILWSSAERAGKDWTKFFTSKQFPSAPSVKGKASNFQHGVNVAQGLRYPAQKYRMHPSNTLRHQCRDALYMVMQSHGTPSGAFSSDEYLGGTSPQRGVEVCCTAELIFSMNYLYCLLGDTAYVEQAELAALNALPAAVSVDWWSHQYITQVNQPWATEFALKQEEKTPFYDVGRYANVFGLEPEYPCCTVNHPVAFPKLAMNIFLRIAQADAMKSGVGILHAFLLPAELHFPGYRIRCETAYPFSDRIIYTISCAEDFDFFIRVPTWVSSKSMIRTSETDDTDFSLEKSFQANHTAGQPLAMTYKVPIPRSSHFRIELELDADINVHKFANETISIYRGSLLFAYEIPHFTKSALPRNYKDQKSCCTEITEGEAQSSQDWMRHIRDHSLLPKGHWGIAIDAQAPMKFVRDAEMPSDVSTLKESVFTSSTTGMYIEVQAYEIDWPVANGTAADPGAFSAKDLVRGSVFTARLVPYGCAKLHLAQFPTVQGSKAKI